MTNGGDGGQPSSSSGVTCAAVPVDVEGKQAVWIFTEFETGESLSHLRDWLIPEHWPDWGGEMFKEMRPISSVDLRPAQGTAQQTHSKYLEVVEIGGHRLETELRCEFKSTQAWAAISYDLDRSIGDMLQVDRGYLMAADVGGRRHVKALKVVGFTDTLLNTVATQVCPEWSIWVQTRDEGGRGPGRRRLGRPDSRLGRRLGPQGRSVRRGRRRRSPAAWPSSGSSTVTDMVDFYAPFTADVTERVWSGRYGQVDAANDTTRLFQRLARDWSRAWQAGMDSMSNWAEVTVRPTAGADPGRSARTIEHTTLMVRARSDKARVSISDLTRVGRRPATIKASEVTITPPVIDEAGRAYVTIQAETSNVPCWPVRGRARGRRGRQAGPRALLRQPRPARWGREGTDAVTRGPGTAGSVGGGPAVAADRSASGVDGRCCVHRSLGPRGRARRRRAGRRSSEPARRCR